METTTETRPPVLVNIIDADGVYIAREIMEYEVPDFLALRVDPQVAATCRIEPAER